MFTNIVPKPKSSETWNGSAKPKVSETYAKSGKPKASETWTNVRLETAPASPAAGVGESGYQVLDDNDMGPGNNKFV